MSIVGLARLIPRPMGLKLFSGLGGLVDRVFTKDRKRAVDNMAIAFPESSYSVRRAMTRAMFKNMGRNVYDFINLEGASADALARLVENVQGMDNFEKARQKGKGIIVITGHIGCFEIMPAYFSSLGHAVNVVARRLRDKKLNDRLVAVRASVGVRTVDRDAGAREMIRVLHRGELLGVLIDQHTDVAGVYVPFFGRPAFTPTGVAKLSCLTGASILPMAVFLNRKGKHVIHVLPPIEPPRDISNKENAIEALTAEYSLAVERLIRVDPKQWAWFHHRWREPGATNVGYAADA